MKFHIGDKLTLKISTNEYITYSVHEIINERNMVLEYKEDGELSYPMVDIENVTKRLGISWTHEPLIPNHFNKDLFTL